MLGSSGVVRHLPTTKVERCSSSRTKSVKVPPMSQPSRYTVPPVDLRLSIYDLRFEPDWDQVRREFEELGFKSIVAKLPGAANTSEVKPGGSRENPSEVKNRKKQTIPTSWS